MILLGKFSLSKEQAEIFVNLLHSDFLSLCCVISFLLQSSPVGWSILLKSNFFFKYNIISMEQEWLR